MSFHTVDHHSLLYYLIVSYARLHSLGSLCLTSVFRHEAELLVAAWLTGSLRRACSGLSSRGSDKVWGGLRNLNTKHHENANTKHTRKSWDILAILFRRMEAPAPSLLGPGRVSCKITSPPVALGRPPLPAIWKTKLYTIIYIFSYYPRLSYIIFYYAGIHSLHFRFSMSVFCLFSSIRLNSL